jgi:predicted phage tail protein
MTKISIHGILGSIFGSEMSLSGCSATSILRGIDANREGFLNKIIELANKGHQYAIIVDGESVSNPESLVERRKIDSIYILPIIAGSGDGGLGAVIGEIIVNIAISTAVSVGISFLMAALNKTAAPPSVMIAVGGESQALDGRGRSYIFSNNQNTESQGSPIPIGYGRLRISSKIIEASVKNYSTNEYAGNQFKISSDASIISEYISE